LPEGHPLDEVGLADAVPAPEGLDNSVRAEHWEKVAASITLELVVMEAGFAVPV
jgi:hypothetical protein